MEYATTLLSTTFNMTAHFYSVERILPGEVVSMGQFPVRVIGFERVKGRDKRTRYKCYFERCSSPLTSGLEKLTQCIDNKEISVLEIV